MELRDAGDPVSLAQRYNDQGADEVVFLDITASKEHRGTLIEVIRRAADRLFLPLTVGGGIRSIDDIQAILRAGADKVSINTSAVHDPDSSARVQGFSGPSVSFLRWTCGGILPRTLAGHPSRFLTVRACRYEAVVYGGSRPTGIDAIRWAKEAEERGAGRHPHEHGNGKHKQV